MKLLRLLNRFLKPRDRRRRENTAALSSIAGCERVLEQRVLLSAAAPDVEQKTQQATDDASADNVSSNAATSGGTGQAFVASADLNYVITDDAANPQADVWSGPFHNARFPSKAAAVSDSVDFVSIDSAGHELTRDAADVPDVLDLKSPLQLSESTESESKADSANDVAGFEEDQVRSAESETEILDADPVSATATTARGPTSGVFDAEWRLPLFQNAQPAVVSRALIDPSCESLEFSQSNSVPTEILRQARSRTVVADSVLTSSAIGPPAGGFVDVSESADAELLNLSGLVFFGSARSGLVASASPGGTLPEWLTLGGDAFEASPLIRFARTSVISHGFAEATVSVSQVSLSETTKHALGRIEAELAAVSADAVRGDDPPERSDVPGVWQRLRFDCNPRGPPCEELNLISGFTRQTGGDDQLRQLKFSIAPRGPSVAFCS